MFGHQRECSAAQRWESWIYGYFGTFGYFSENGSFYIYVFFGDDSGYSFDECVIDIHRCSWRVGTPL